jgi:hypothetical protein
MTFRTSLLTICVGMIAFGGAMLPAKAEDGRNAAAAAGAIAGFAAGAAASQGGYYGARRGPEYRGRVYGYDEGWRRRRWDRDDEGDGWRRRRSWCYYHPDRC